jgi:hypothetical protein
MPRYAKSVAILGIGLALATPACNRWRPARYFEVAQSAPGPAPARRFELVKQVLAEDNYQVTRQDEAKRTTRVRAHTHDHVDSMASFLELRVTDDGKVVITPSGYLVRADGTIHRRLETEIELIQLALYRRFRHAGSPAPSEAPKAPDSGGPPIAWSERAYEPSTWGSDEFTCIPAKIAPEDQAELELVLSNGETAAIAISIAYAPELCRSPKQCKLAGGCPALGLGDERQVQALAERLAKREIAGQATLTARGQPIAQLDLSRHGSIAKALLQLNK